MKRLAVLLGAIAMTVAGPAAAVSMETSASAVVGQVGKTNGREWRVLFSSHDRERCVGLQVSFSSAEVCGGEPDLVWRRVLGNGVDTAPPAALEVDLTSTAVHKLRLVIGHPGERGSFTTRRTLRTRRLSEAQARKAGIRRDFRFAVIASKTRNQCVKRVVAIAGDGGVLMRADVPCEY
jgi:hypothetical protein